MSLISVLCNTGMRTRHWDRMSEIVSFDLTPDAGTTLRKMLKLNLYPHLAEFEEVSVGATKVETFSLWGMLITKT